jgi:hypothetical protein
MALHAAAMLAVLVDQVAQAPVLIQCVQQSAPESWVKWLLPTIVQTVVSLASIGTGVGIAVWSFRRNRQSEHEQWVRNQKAGHEQWIRDQKKAEWKELLIKVAAIEGVIPVVTSGLPEYRDLEPTVLAILPLLRGNIFIHHAIKSCGFIERWELFTQYIAGEFEAGIRQDNDLRRGLLDVKLTSEVLTSGGQVRRDSELEVRTRLHSLRDELRTLAQKELGN